MRAKGNARGLHIPSRDIVVDEAMIPFQGRSSLKQFMPMKPVKRGIKVLCLADISNGFVANFEVYTGRGEDVPEDAETTLGARGLGSLSQNTWREITITSTVTTSLHHPIFL